MKVWFRWPGFIATLRHLVQQQDEWWKRMDVIESLMMNWGFLRISLVSHIIILTNSSKVQAVQCNSDNTNTSWIYTSPGGVFNSQMLLLLWFASWSTGKKHSQQAIPALLCKLRFLLCSTCSFSQQALENILLGPQSLTGYIFRRAPWKTWDIQIHLVLKGGWCLDMGTVYLTSSSVDPGRERCQCMQAQQLDFRFKAVENL